MDTNKFLEDYETFLNDANTNLGRKASKNRIAFIEEALSRVSDFVCQTKKPPASYPNRENMMILSGKKARESQSKPNVHVMTEEDSLKSDQDRG